VSTPDDFEQALVDDIADADVVGDELLAAELRLELNAYRSARQAAEGGDDPAGARDHG
jgi:hypothetical protein